MHADWMHSFTRQSRELCNVDQLSLFTISTMGKLYANFIDFDVILSFRPQELPSAYEKNG